MPMIKHYPIGELIHNRCEEDPELRDQCESAGLLRITLELDETEYPLSAMIDDEGALIMCTSAPAEPSEVRYKTEFIIIGENTPCEDLNNSVHITSVVCYDGSIVHVFEHVLDE